MGRPPSGSEVLTEEPSSSKTNGHFDLPGMVNTTDEHPHAAHAVDAVVPDRFTDIRAIAAAQPLGDDTAAAPDHPGCPLLAARDTAADDSLVSLQLFTAPNEHARVRECQQRCCLRPNDAPRSPTSSLTSPMSSPRGEPMLCDIYEIHGDGGDGGWLAVMEEVTGTMGNPASLSTQQKRNLFLRVARAVQMLHSAGLVHNSINTESVFICDSGYKLGDYSTLQRHGEMAKERRKGTWMAPELKQSVLQIESLPIKCDFATDVWCLGALLSELVLGGMPKGDLGAPETFEEAGEDVGGLLSRMLGTEPSTRPVIDVVLQEAIRCLYLPKDGTSSPHDTLDFDSPLKANRPVVGNSTLKNDDLEASMEASPLGGTKARPIDFSLPAPARRFDAAGTDDEELENPRDVQVKQEQASKHRSDAADDTSDSASSNCECRCAVQ